LEPIQKKITSTITPTSFIKSILVLRKNPLNFQINLKMPVQIILCNFDYLTGLYLLVWIQFTLNLFSIYSINEIEYNRIWQKYCHLITFLSLSFVIAKLMVKQPTLANISGITRHVLASFTRLLLSDQCPQPLLHEKKKSCVTRESNPAPFGQTATLTAATFRLHVILNLVQMVYKRS
jgi:hypothetical protein